jgi:hypothetical protein
MVVLKDATGPLLPFATSPCRCSRNPHCRHSLRQHVHGVIELTLYESRRKFIAIAPMTNPVFCKRDLASTFHGVPGNARPFLS